MIRQISMKRFVSILALVASFEAMGQDSLTTITTAVPFLRISPDARAGGMGDVGIATNPDATSIFWNLAKIPFSKTHTAISATYSPWLRDLGVSDVYLFSASGYRHIDEFNAVSGSVRFFNLGSIQYTNEYGDNTTTGNPRELGLDIGYSRKLTENIGLGVALRYINSNLVSGTVNNNVYKVGKTVAGDISLYRHTNNENGSGLSWGIAFSNLGGKIGYTADALNKDYIPANMGLGLAYTIVPDESNKLTFALDVNKLLVPVPPTTGDSASIADYRSKSVVKSWTTSFSDGGGLGNQLKKLQVSAGAEYSYSEQFLLRAGYFYEDVTQGNRKYFTLGAGLRYNVFGVNISYLVPSGNGVTRNPLSNTLRFGLTFDLDAQPEGALANPN